MLPVLTLLLLTWLLDACVRYDAVTTAGVLEWQDTLSELNKPFFEAADAIFINYTWKEDTPAKAAAVAGDRRRDVYMGVDVFGRNTYGGGGMTCNVALKAAHSPGKPFETGQLHCTTTNLVIRCSLVT